MKAISTTLIIVVTVIVVLVTALVVLTIFTGGVRPIVDLTTQKNLCLQQASVSCMSTGKMPATWHTQFEVIENGQKVTKTCKGLEGLGTCECNDKKQLDCPNLNK